MAASLPSLPPPTNCSCRLALQSCFDLNSSQNVTEFGVWRGFNNVKQGLYLRYGIRREFASYIGINWIHQPGDTADLTRAADDPSEDLPSVFGLRLGW